MLSICESTNFLLVSATVTTSTIEALPMMTPSDVSIARTLFARSASIATETVSRQSIIASHRCFLREFEELQPWEFSAFLEPFQRFLRHLVLGIELQRSFDHFDRQFPFVGLAKLVLGPEPKDTGLAGYLSQNLGIAVEQGRLEDVLELGPQVAFVGDEAWRLFYVLGAALRSEVKAL